MNKLISLSRGPLTSSLKKSITNSIDIKFPYLRWKSYAAAILEEYDKPLIVTKIKNDTPVGPGMVRIKLLLIQ